MNCPDNVVLQDFIEGELPKEELLLVVEHVRSCEICRKNLHDMISIFKIMSKVVNEDACPSVELLESYVLQSSLGEKSEQITKHVALCEHCKFYIWALQASEKELTEWQTQEEQAYQEYEAFDTAKETLQKLLPNKLELIDNIWQSVLAFVLDLKGKAIENWPSFDTGTHLVGVLGFEESYDPEAEAASIIMATTLYVSQAISDGQVKPCQEDIETLIRDVAAKLGAGKELRKRLIETVPPIVLEFK